MHRNLKTFSLVLAAVFAISGVATLGASAAEFHTAKVPTVITGTQKTALVFTTNAGTVTCTTAKYTGTQEVLTTTVERMRPTFENCTAFGFIGIKIDPNGCEHVYYANGTSTIECPAGKEIEITVPFCTTSVGPQDMPTGVSYATQGTSPNRHILATVNISGITYNECGTVRTNGKLTGTIDLTSSASEDWYL